MGAGTMPHHARGAKSRFIALDCGAKETNPLFFHRAPTQYQVGYFIDCNSTCTDGAAAIIFPHDIR
jgi:hypothetical protein